MSATVACARAFIRSIERWRGDKCNSVAWPVCYLTKPTFGAVAAIISPRSDEIEKLRLDRDHCHLLQSRSRHVSRRANDASVSRWSIPGACLIADLHSALFCCAALPLLRCRLSRCAVALSRAAAVRAPTVAATSVASRAAPAAAAVATMQVSLAEGRARPAPDHPFAAAPLTAHHP